MSRLYFFILIASLGLYSLNLSAQLLCADLFEKDTQAIVPALFSDGSGDMRIVIQIMNLFDSLPSN